MNKIVIAGIGFGATVVGYAVGSIFGKKVNTKVSNTAKHGAEKIKNVFKRKGENPGTEEATAAA